MQRRRDLSDKRRILAVITPAGRQVAADATEPLNKIQFGLGALDEADAAAINGVLRHVRVRRHGRRRPRPLVRSLRARPTARTSLDVQLL